MDNIIRKNPKISVLVLSYNNFKYYKECINSILCQSYSDIEIVISDDASKNFDKDKLLSYIKTNKKENIKNVIVNINNDNIGVVKNYNKAIALSTGEYIFYLAIDDIFYDKEVLEDTVKFFQNTDYLIFTGYKDVYDLNMKQYIKTLPRENEVKFLISDNVQKQYESLCKGSFISGSNTPFSRKLIDKYGYLDEKYFYLEDYPRYLNLTRHGCKIGFYNRKLIKYRMGGVTTSGEISKLLRKDLYLATVSECRNYFIRAWKNEWIENRTLIGWGTGDCCINVLKKLDKKFKYLVDSNKDAQGNKINGLNVYSPKILREENKSEIFILVFTYANYFDISRKLELYGYEEGKNFFCCTPNILDVIEEELI